MKKTTGVADLWPITAWLQAELQAAATGRGDEHVRGASGFSSAASAYLWDADGNRYLDLLAGLAVNALGHAHTGAWLYLGPTLTLGHVSNTTATALRSRWPNGWPVR